MKVDTKLYIYNIFNTHKYTHTKREREKIETERVDCSMFCIHNMWQPTMWSYYQVLGGNHDLSPVIGFEVQYLV